MADLTFEQLALMDIRMTNTFHAALVKVHDIAKNGTRNTAAWQEVLETVDAALAEGRAIDKRKREGS